MLLGGLWHGAGWTFIAWGGLHGTALAVNHMARRRGLFVPSALGWLLTMLVVLVGWVLFGAPTFAAATAMLSGMLGLHGGQAADALPRELESWIDRRGHSGQCPGSHQSDSRPRMGWQGRACAQPPARASPPAPFS